MELSLRRAWILAPKDLSEMQRRRYVIFSLGVMPVALAVILPLIFIQLPLSGANIETIPELFRPSFPHLTNLPPTGIALLLLGNFVTPIFLLLPAILPSVIASYSFIGEKTSRSLEPLLATPASDIDLLLGKYLSAFIPSMAATYGAFLVFAGIVDSTALPVLGYLVVLSPPVLVLMLVVAPLYGLLSIAANVYVSAKTTDVRSAQQISGLVVLPIVVLLVGPFAGVFALGPEGVSVLAGLLVSGLINLGYLSISTFHREEILVRWR